MLIGREKEINILNDLYHSEEAELIALYGRRRVGKTYLIDEVFSNKISFRHAGLSPIDRENKNVKTNLMKDQLTHFFRSLTMQGYKGKKTPESWLDAFYMLEDLLMEKSKDNERSVVFLDEMQWLDTPRAKFMTGFEAFWNGWACHRKNLMVIVCGSSSSWILNNIVNNHGGLYGRVTYEIKLRPFSLKECEQFFTAKEICMSRYDLIQAYMMVGGIPYYLRYFNKRLSLAQNINAIFFADEAPLKDEFNRMFASLFKNAEPIKQIIKAIASKNKGITRKELSEITGVTDSGEVTRQLKALIAGDFIIKYKSFGDSKRDEIYKLIDPFSYFYLTFLDKAIDNRNIDWINIEDSNRVLTWKGYAFENVCWNHIPQIKMALQIGGVSTTEALWSKRGDENTRGTQIDLIIVRKDNVVHMCEIKFYNDEFEVDKDYHLILERRKKMLREHISKRATIHNTLITTYGLRKTNYFGDFVHVLTIDQLFEN